MLEFALKLDKDAKTPIYIQLYNYFKHEIISGRMQPNTKLPSIRRLAQYLNLSRTTVEVAYHQLCVEGYIVSKPKSGYFINKIESTAFHGKSSGEMSEENTGQASIKESVKYDFRNDYIDKESFDFSLWKKYLNKALMTDNERFLTYGSYQGEYELRREIAQYVHRSRGVVCTPDQVVIGAGVQSVLSILCGILKPHYGAIGFEDPGFKQARHIFRDHNFEIIPIKLEQDGISIKSLTESKTKLVYVSPSNQFPMGSVMPINKRIQLLKWAYSSDKLIIEDDYDSELRYFGRPIPSLQGLNEGANVIYLGSFSKILLPSLRISYMILPPNWLKVYKEKMTQYNQTSSQIEQVALALFMKEGLLEKHIRKVRKIYAKKNQLLIEAIDKLMKNKVKVMGKETGLHVLMEIRSDYSAEEIVSLAEKVGVKVIPLSNYQINSDEKKYPLVLLSYGGIPLGHIEPAIKLLKKVWFDQD